MLSVDRFTERDKNAYADLWREYESGRQREDSCDSLVESHWKALHDSSKPLRALCLRDAGIPIGFALYVQHFCTKSIRPECYLSDLYVSQTHRRKGGAKCLLDALVDTCREAGIYRISWITKPENAPARALYDRYADGTTWVRYKLTTRP